MHYDISFGILCDSIPTYKMFSDETSNPVHGGENIFTFPHYTDKQATGIVLICS